MLLPRRRITSLTLASIIVFTLWYLNLIPGFSSGGGKRAPLLGVKQKPADARLTPATAEESPQEKPSPVADAGAFAPKKSDVKEPSPSILTDTRPPVAANFEHTDPPPGDDFELIASAKPKTGSSGSSKGKSSHDATSKTTPSSNTKSNATDSGSTAAPSIKTQQSPFKIGSYVFTEKHPIKKYRPFAQGEPAHMPRLQHSFEAEDREARKIRLGRLDAVKKSFAHSWAGYKMHAWKKDELQPVEGGSVRSFGGWAASLVDTLDTLWIVGMKQEFEEAVKAVADIDFNTAEEETLNVFETNIRYLGGFLGAYDLSHDHDEYPILLQKAVEVGDLLYCAFDTPNRMPVVRWQWEKALDGGPQTANPGTLIAEIGSLTLEFTRLSQLTGDMKYYDAITRIMDEFRKAQSDTKIPGLWPVLMNAKDIEFNDNGFTLGGMADSLYEYLPKQHMLLGGLGKMYQEMYEYAITSAMNHIFFQPMLPDNADVLISGSASVSSSKGIQSKAEGQHLGCYAGGMVGIAGKIFKHPEHINMARKLVDGCIWAYQHMPTGIMPEVFTMLPCEMNSDCQWDEKKWKQAVIKSADQYSDDTGKPINAASDEEKYAQTMKQRRLTPGFLDIQDRRYILRPEAIESVFIHYRLTGDEDLPDKAWQMFTAIENATRTNIANSAIDDVTVATKAEIKKANKMESFWMAETLKYFYLMFEEPDVVSLDDYVLLVSCTCLSSWHECEKRLTDLKEYRGPSAEAVEAC